MITETTYTIHILIKNIEDKIVWKFSSASKFSVKTVIWANNDSLGHYLKVKFINSICRGVGS